MPAALRACRPHGIAYDEMETSFFLGRETLVPPSIRASAGGGASCSSRSRTRPRRPRPSSASRPTAPSSSATRSRSEDGQADARPAARPAQHAPSLRAPDRRPGRHRRHRRAGAHRLRLDRRHGARRPSPLRRIASRWAASRWAATSRSRSCAGRRTGRTAGPDRHPGRARHARSDGTAARLHRADARSAGSMACSPRCCRTLVHPSRLQDAGDASRSSTWPGKSAPTASCASSRRSWPGPTADRCWSTSRYRRS